VPYTHAVRKLPLELRPTVRSERARLVLLPIGRALAPVEHEVRRKVHQPVAKSRGLLAQHRHRSRIDGARPVLVRLRRVHVRVGRGIHHHVGANRPQLAHDRILVGDVELSLHHTHDLGEEPQNGNALMSHLPIGAEYESPHHHTATRGTDGLVSRAGGATEGG